MLVKNVIKKISPAFPALTTFIGLVIFHNAWLAVGGYFITAIIIISIYGDDSCHPLKQHNKSTFIFQILLGLVTGIPLYYLWPILIPDNSAFNNQLTSLGLGGISFLLFLIYIFFINPFMEEAFWRGYLRNDNPRIILNDCWFAIYHVIVMYFFIPIQLLPLVMISLTIASWHWRQVVKKNDGLKGSSLSHLAADLSLFCALLLRIYL
ncbi:MAG: CPBP family glutamic-type intramembrane protease [bacterium]